MSIEEFQFFVFSSFKQAQYELHSCKPEQVRAVSLSHYLRVLK